MTDAPLTPERPLTPEQRRKALEFIAYQQRFWRWKFFRPYPKQLAFYALGRTKRERLFMAGNQVGKSEAGAFEATCHSTGLYPQWWPGRRFDHPTRGWAAGVTSLDVRNVLQRKLCGTPGVDADWGTGMIPKEHLLDKSLARGITDAYDQIQVRHVTGGTSIIQFKSYEQGRAKFQGDTIDWGWADEEPEKQEVYDEFLTRLTGDGILFTTFTPLFGPTLLVDAFTGREHPDRGMVTMSLDEAEHFSAEQREKRLAGYKPHERDARARGIPKLGSGAIFLTPEEIVVEQAISYVPEHWAKLWGIDFGIGHPFAAVLLLWDRDTDVMHVHHCIRMADTLPIVHAHAMRQVGGNVPVAWPKDGGDREKSTGAPLAAAYRKFELRMMAGHATFPDGGYSTEAGIQEIDDREKTGRIRYASHLNELLEERRFYHRKDGQIVKLRDDIMSALRQAVMAKRFARPVLLGAAAVRETSTGIAKGIDFDVFGAA